MSTMRSVVSIFSAVMMALGTGVAAGQNFPNKPVRILTQDVGGATDLLARMFAPDLAAGLGQQVIIDNRGANAVIGDIVAKASPDGYTMLLSGAVFWITPFMQKLPYDPVRDFLPVTMTNSQPNVLVVHPSLPVKSVKELIALAKARPGELNYASGQTGAANHLNAELFKSLAGVNIVRVPFKGAGPAINAVVASEVPIMFPSTSGAAPHIKSGRLRGLAVTTAQPSVLAPGLPPLAATIPGYESESLTAIFAPAKTPAAIINRLNQEIVRALNLPEVKQRILDAGSVVVGSSPAQSATMMKSDMAIMGKLIKDVGIKLEQ